MVQTTNRQGSESYSGKKIPRSKIRTGSIPVAGTKKADTHSGICFFSMPVGLEPQMRVRGATRPPPVAESREGSAWPRSARDEGAYVTEDIRLAPQQDCGNKNSEIPSGSRCFFLPPKFKNFLGFPKNRHFSTKYVIV